MATQQSSGGGDAQTMMHQTLKASHGVAQQAAKSHSDALAKLHQAIMSAQGGGGMDPSQMMGDPSQQDQGAQQQDPQEFVQQDPQGAAAYADAIMQHLAAMLQDQMTQPQGAPQPDASQPAPYVGGGGAGY